MSRHSLLKEPRRRRRRASKARSINTGGAARQESQWRNMFRAKPARPLKNLEKESFAETFFVRHALRPRTTYV
jgi:hypothetical protein